VGTEVEGRAGSRRRFFVAGAIGAALAVVVFLGVVLDGKATIFALGRPSSDLSGELSRFYDAQAESLLDLRWDVPPQVLGVEGFRMDDGDYIYFGPWPAVLRMPLAAVTDAFEGRLTQVSMLLALLVALAFTLRLAWRVRVLVLGDTPVGWGEAVMVGGFTFVVGAGSALVFLGSELVVFHEALIWGAAWSIAAFELLITFSQTLRWRHLVATSAAILLALFSRAALGVGPLIALGILLAAVLLGRGLRLTGMAEGASRRRFALPMAAALVVPVAAYVALNLVKFGTAFSLPFDRQMASIFSSTHRAVLLRNNGSLVGLQFLPTNLLQYFRPDAIAFGGSFPWVRFPEPATIVGSVRFDQVMPASSVPTTMPLLTVLGLVGLVGVFVGLPARVRSLAALRAPVVGCVAATAITLTFGFIANRYVADFVPLVVLLGVAGMYATYVWVTARPSRTRARIVWGTAAVLALVSVWFSAGLAVVWQRGWDQEILEGPTLPTHHPELATVFILGDCDGLYRSAGNEWRALELTPRTGQFRWRARLPGGRVEGREPILVSGPPGRTQAVFVEYLPGNQVLFGAWLEGRGKMHKGRAVPFDPAAEHTLDVTVDAQVPAIQVRFDGPKVFEHLAPNDGVIDPVQDVTVGANMQVGKIAPRFSGQLQEVPLPTRDCRKFQQLRTQRIRTARF
jgi:hypothetical protein